MRDRLYIVFIITVFTIFALVLVAAITTAAVCYPWLWLVAAPVDILAVMALLWAVVQSIM